MGKFDSLPYSVSQSRRTIPRKQKLEQKQEQEEHLPNNFESIYSAVIARWKTSNNKHLNELILNSPRIKLSQPSQLDNIILDN